MTDHVSSRTSEPLSKKPFWFPAARAGHSQHYTSWRHYHRALVPENNEIGTRLFAIASRALDGVRTDAKDTDDPDRVAWRNALQELPWTTFVLGSGCLSPARERDDTTTPAAETEAAVRDALRPITTRYEGAGLDDIAVDYLHVLVRDKARGGAGGATIDADPQADWTLRALTVAAAALASGLYGLALASSPHVVGRADRELAVVHPETYPGTDAVTNYIAPLVDVLGLLEADAEPELAHLRALQSLAKALKAGLVGSAPHVRRTHVELLTAFAWFFLTAGSTVYPGWNELMLFQAFDDERVFPDENHIPADYPSPRPAVGNVTGQEDWVKARIGAVTARSWSERRGRPSTAVRSADRIAFYDTVAELLHAQAAARPWLATDPHHHAPLPVCFVSSFDLELEMALWSTGRPFIVVIPTFASDDAAPGKATLVWQMTRIDPTTAGSTSEDELPSELVAPRHWGELSEETLRKLGTPAREIREGRTPVVVRLTGSPLLDLSALNDASRRRSEDPPTTKQHALVVDEYTAIQQAAADLNGNGLPAALTRGSLRGPQRFWMMLGTQLEDSAVRFRLMVPHVVDRRSGAAARQTHEPVRGEGYRAGVLVNENSPTSHRELFYWHDLDVVDAAHLDVAADLTALVRRTKQALSTIEELYRTTHPTVPADDHDQEIPE